jgi:hypothetical protein
LCNPEFGLHKPEYNGWKVFYFVGNPNLNQKYKIENNVFTMQCEDSYIHVLKKVVMAIEIIFELYHIEEGILRCGDDLVFDEKNLIKFIENKNKTDYEGELVTFGKNNEKRRLDYFMPNYFVQRPEELLNPMNGLQNFTLNDIVKFCYVPNCSYLGGVICFISQKSCQFIIKTMKSINYDILTYDPEYGYPYIIEDIGVGFILKNFGIYPTQRDLYSNEMVDFSKTEFIGCHTNYNK